MTPQSHSQACIPRKDTCTAVCAAALLTMPGHGSSLNVRRQEWIKKAWYLYTMEYCSAIKRNELAPLAEMWMDLEVVIQGEGSQKEKNQIHHLYVESRKTVEINLFAKQK